MRNTRWHDVSQQETWTKDKGNYCFIDPATEEEIESMAVARHGEAGAAEALQAFEFVGGVPRVCIEAPTGAKDLVDGAISAYEIKPIVNMLSLLADSADGKSTKEQGSNGTKIYPGLVGHIFPTNSFRNDFKIRFPSPYTARRLVAKEKLDTEKKLQDFMQDLLVPPKARSFGGWIWEHLLTKTMSGESAQITIWARRFP